MVVDPYMDFVCIREIQKSLKFSARKLVIAKIYALKVQHLFDITDKEIRRKGSGANGVMIFQGMQDHTADSIKSLEGFGRAWVEEAQSMSKNSLELLIPTIRSDGSEIWFSWNPKNPDDAVEQHFEGTEDDDDFVRVHVDYDMNPFCPEGIKKEAERMRAKDPEKYHHVWKGGFSTRNDAQILKDKWKIEEFEPQEDWDGPYHGLDFGFANDPTAAVKCWINNGNLYIEREAGKVGLEIDDHVHFLKGEIPSIDKYVVRADSARPECISYMRRNGMPLTTGVKKGKGSVEDGITHLRSYNNIIVHPRCEEVARECRLYSYKTDKHSGDVLPVVADKDNHYMDALRYALEPLTGLGLEGYRTANSQPDEEVDAWGRKKQAGGNAWTNV